MVYVENCFGLTFLRLFWIVVLLSFLLFRVFVSGFAFQFESEITKAKGREEAKSIENQYIIQMLKNK